MHLFNFSFTSRSKKNRDWEPCLRLLVIRIIPMQILSRYTSGTVLLVLWHLSLQQPEAKVKLPSMKVLCSFTSSNEHKWWHTKQCIVKLPKIPTLHSFYNFMLLSILIFINEFLFLFFVCILVYFVGGGGVGGGWELGHGVREAFSAKLCQVTLLYCVCLLRVIPQRAKRMLKQLTFK